MMYFISMILRIETHIDDQTGNIVESITPAFDETGKPVLISSPIGFKGKAAAQMIVNRGLQNEHKQMIPLEFPIEAKNIFDSFVNFNKFRDAEINSMRSLAAKRQLAGGPKVEFEVVEG